jgi:hypothetical protein
LRSIPAEFLPDKSGVPILPRNAAFMRQFYTLRMPPWLALVTSFR